MVEYYNMSDMFNKDGFMEILVSMSQGSNGAIAYFILGLVFILPTMIAYYQEKDIVIVMLYSSLITFMMSIILYVIKALENSIGVWASGLLFGAMLVVSFMNRR